MIIVIKINIHIEPAASCPGAPSPGFTYHRSYKKQKQTRARRPAPSCGQNPENEYAAVRHSARENQCPVDRYSKGDCEYKMQIPPLTKPLL